MTDLSKMQQKLYAIDVALVGPTRAISRWQFHHPIYGWRAKEVSPPGWSDNRQYRRNPKAPALPSWDWHEAPYGMQWRAEYGYSVGFTDANRRSAESLSDGTPESIEERPPKAWFEATRGMTRDEYEALQRLARGGAVKPASDEPADNGVLSGADALERIVVPAMREGGRWWENIEAHVPPASAQRAWKQCQVVSDVFMYVQRGDLIRRKLETYYLIDRQGVRHEWPEPMQEPPKKGSFVWIACPGHKDVESLEWVGDSFDMRHLKRGLVYATREDAVAMRDALLAASTPEKFS